MAVADLLELHCTLRATHLVQDQNPKTKPGLPELIFVNVGNL